MLVVMTSVSVFALPVYFPELFNRSHGKIWWISTNDPIHGDMMFSGKYVDESTIVAQYYIGGEYTEVVPKRIVLTTHKVTLYFDPADLPEEQTDGTVVTGALKNGLEFEATGPGFLKRKWR